MIRPVVLACLVALAAVGAPASTGCVSTASQRVSTLSAALVTVDAARAAFLAYDSGEQADIVAKAASAEAGNAALVAYRAKRLGVERAFTAAYMAVASASTLNDDPSLAGAQAALKQLVAAVQALTGGSK